MAKHIGKDGRKLKPNTKKDEAAPSSGRIAKAAFRFFAVYALFVALFMIWFEGYHYAVAQQWFDVEEIDVVGLKRVQREEIILFSGLRTGVPIFDVDVRRTNQRMEAHPWVKKARVSRRLPNALYIEITEHKPVAKIKLDRIYFVNDEGTPFKVVTGANPESDLVMIEGLEMGDFDDSETGRELVRRALQLIADYQVHAMASLAKLRTVRFRHNQFELEAGDVPTRLVIGKSNRQDALDRATKLWRHLETEGKVPEEIHLDNRKEPERVSVRLRSDEMNRADSDTRTSK